MTIGDRVKIVNSKLFPELIGKTGIIKEAHPACLLIELDDPVLNIKHWAVGFKSLELV